MGLTSQLNSSDTNAYFQAQYQRNSEQIKKIQANNNGMNVRFGFMQRLDQINQLSANLRSMLLTHKVARHQFDRSVLMTEERLKHSEDVFNQIEKEIEDQKKLALENQNVINNFKKLSVKDILEKSNDIKKAYELLQHALK